MSYIDEVLMPYETLKFRCKPHWVVYAPTILWVIAFFGSWIFLPNTDFGQFSIFGSPKFYVLMGYLTLILGTITGLMSYITYISSEYGITDRRVLMKTGLIRRRSLEIYLKRIESILVLQSVPGRILNYGSIIISGTGGSKDVFGAIPNPLEFRKLTQRQLYESERRNDDDE